MVFDGEFAEGVRESLCTLGNGYLATRGAAPEHRADGIHYPGTYLAGCYNRLRDTVHGEAVETESMVNIPNWMPMTLRIGDGPWLGQAGLDLVEERYELDLWGGQLTRQFQVRDAQSRVATVTQRRLVHRRLANVCGLQTTITPHGWSGDVTFAPLWTRLSRIAVWCVTRVCRAGTSAHRCGPSGSTRETVLCVVETNQSHIRIAVAARTRVFDPPGGCSRRDAPTEAGIGQELTVRGHRRSAGHGGKDRDGALFTRRRDLST